MTREMDASSRSLVSRIEDAMQSTRPIGRGGKEHEAMMQRGPYRRPDTWGPTQEEMEARRKYREGSVQDIHQRELEEETQRALHDAKEMAKRRVGSHDVTYRIPNSQLARAQTTRSAYY